MRAEAVSAVEPNWRDGSTLPGHFSGCLRRAPRLVPTAPPVLHLRLRLTALQHCGQQPHSDSGAGPRENTEFACVLSIVRALEGRCQTVLHTVMAAWEDGGESKKILDYV